MMLNGEVFCKSFVLILSEILGIKKMMATIKTVNAVFSFC